MNLLSAPPMSPFVSQPSENHPARFAHRRLSSSVAVICARGYIDASNADALTEYTHRHLTGCRALILDLHDVTFFGTEGFSALHRVSVSCARAGASWVVIPSAAISRLLRIGDPQGLLPAASTVEAALAIIHEQPHWPPSPSRPAEISDDPAGASSRSA